MGGRTIDCRAALAEVVAVVTAAGLPGAVTDSFFGGWIVAHTDTRRNPSTCITYVAAGTNACVD